MKTYGLISCLLITILTIFLPGCTNVKYAPELLEVETFIRAKPDSALRLLQQFNTMYYPKQDEALYYMLLTQAEDKCYVKHQSDSLIAISVDYFRHSGDDLHLARALYLNGRVKYDEGDHAHAAELYVKVRDVAEGGADYNIQYLICSHLGSIYYENHLADKSLESYTKAERFAELSRDSISMSYANSYIGRAYVLQEEFGKSIAAYLQGIEIAEQISQTRCLRLGLSELSAVYRQVSCYQKSLECLRRVQQLPDYESNDNSSILFKIGDSYRLMGKTDSAVVYLEKALHSSSINTRSAAQESLTYLYEGLENYEESMKYNKMYLASRDSIRKIGNLQQVAKVEVQHLNEKMGIKQFKTTRALFLLLLILILITTVFVVLYRRIGKKKRESDFAHEQSRNQIESLKIVMAEKEMDIQRSRNKISQLRKQMSLLNINIEKEKSKLERLTQDNEKLQEGKDGFSEQLEANKQDIDALNCSLKSIESEKKRYLEEIEQLKQKVIEKETVIAESQDKLSEQLKELEKYQQEWSELSVPIKTFTSEEAKVILKRIKKMSNLADINAENIIALLQSIDCQYTERIWRKNPNLKKGDLKICCLLKAGFSQKEIMELLDLKEDAMNKRMQRLKSRLSLKKKWSKNELEQYISSF